MKEVLELEKEVAEINAARDAVHSGAQQLDALKVKIDGQMPELIGMADPLNPATLSPIALARLQLEFIPERKAQLQAELTGKGACRLCRDHRGRVGQGRETEGVATAALHQAGVRR